MPDTLAELDPLELADRFPYLTSPAALAYADTNGRWRMRPHLSVLNKELAEVGFGLNDRLGVHMPFQHGKTLLASQYFSAWLLLICPWMRLILGSHSERYSGTIGAKVRDVIERFGKPIGVRLRQDSKSRNEWNIDSGPGGWDGGMVCKGYTGGINGRACDLLLLDDVLKNTQQALSPVILETQWEWYQVTAYSRLGPKAPIVMVTTRWVKNDLPGRIYAESKDTGEKWRVIKFKAIAGDDDQLGRKNGEALWPARVPLERLELIKKKRGRWFQACWQQEPSDEQGLYFKPRRCDVPGRESEGWPTYHDLGNAWGLRRGVTRDVHHHDTVKIIVGLDWALGRRKTSDFTAIVVAGLTGDGKLLIFDVVNERLRIEDNAERLAKVCRDYLPRVVAGDDDMLSESMVVECRRHGDIPEIRRLKIAGQGKVFRASAAIIRGENGRIYLPERGAPWLDAYLDQLETFSGEDDEHDDMVDATGILGRLADELNPQIRSRSGTEGPQLLTQGRNVW